MTLLKWKDEYSVSVPALDAQHKELFAMSNELYSAIKDGKGAQATPDILPKLAAYVGKHFDNEEKLMLRANYPKYDSHKTEHEKFAAEVTKMAKQIESGKSADGLELLNHLQKWLLSHILTIDKQYSSHLLNNIEQG